MKIEIERDALHTALRKVVGVVQARTTIPILSNVLLHAERGVLRITGTDLDLQATVRVPAQGDMRITVAAAKFDSAVASFKSGTLTLSVEKPGSLLVKQGRGQRTLPTLPANDFPLRGAMEGGVTFSLPGAVLSRLFGSAGVAMSSEDIRYYLCGVFLHVREGRLIAVATDGHRLVRAEAAMPEGAEAMADIVVPSRTVTHIGKLIGKDEEAVTMHVTSSALSFGIGNVEVASKAVDGTYPDYQRVIPSEWDRTIAIARGALLEPVKAVAAVLNAETDGSARVRSIVLDLKSGEDGCKVTGHDKAGAAAEEPLDADFTGAPVRIVMNARYVVGIAEIFSESGKMMLGAGESATPVRITSERDPDLLAVIMPMRV